mmetsp:Transcript_41839/g.129289  ORF Transcript_41839/g.129289 Transcript_41839/m.129289 type:complete len:237 (-) Transcript_41839:241-951(-)
MARSSYRYTSPRHKRARNASRRPSALFAKGLSPASIDVSFAATSREQSLNLAKATRKYSHAGALGSSKSVSPGDVCRSSAARSNSRSVSESADRMPVHRTATAPTRAACRGYLAKSAKQSSASRVRSSGESGFGRAVGTAGVSGVVGICDVGVGGTGDPGWLPDSVRGGAAAARARMRLMSALASSSNLSPRIASFASMPPARYSGFVRPVPCGSASVPRGAKSSSGGGWRRITAA